MQIITNSMTKAKIDKSVFIIKPLKWMFFTLFFAVFCFSGLLTILFSFLGLPDYRMGLTSLLVLPLLLIYRTKIDRTIFAYTALVFVVLLSGLVNNSSIVEIILFMRILIFSFLIYWLVDKYIRPATICHVIRLCITIAAIQLPIVLLQQSLYHRLPSFVVGKSNATDFDFGTFNYKGDATLAFFLTLVIVFLLNDKRIKGIVRHRWFLIAWLTLTVFLVNSKIMQLAIILVWGTYFLTKFSIKNILLGGFIVISIICVLAFTGMLNTTWANITAGMTVLQEADIKEESFLSGGYGRGAAVAYYIERGILLLGDGPSKYQDAFTRTRFIGNTGHVFTFYGEVGLLGWLLSILIFYYMGFPRCKKCKFRWLNLLCFLILQVLTITSSAMNDIGIMMIYCIVTRIYMMPQTSVSTKRN